MDPSLLTAVGGLGLFLLGMVVMTNGLKEMAGDSIRRTIARFTRSPLSGVTTGATITAIIQSSSATTVTAVGFAGAGLLTLSEALGIIFGANIGTTMTGWIVAVFGFKLQLGTIALPLVLIGTVIHLFGRGRYSAAGLAIAGFGLVFVGIDALQLGMAGLTDVVTPDSFPPDTWLGRVLLVFIGVVITLVTQSSSAGVAMALAAVHAGTISFPQAAAMVIGFDVGTTVTAAIAGLSGGIEAKRVGLAHVVYNLLTGIGAYLLLTPYVWGVDRCVDGGAAANPELALVGFHTLFNFLGVMAALPLTQPFARLIERLIPERSDEVLRRLDRSLLENPSVAIVAAHATLLDITQSVLLRMRRDFDAQPDAIRLSEYAEIRAMLSPVSTFLQGINVPAGNEDLIARLQHLYLASDHLRRLTHRCSEFGRLESIRDDAGLADDAERVSRQIDLLLAGTEIAITKEQQTEAKSLFTAFAGARGRDRHAISELLARGEIDAEQAIAQLDALRWLRRISYHLWRVVRDLRQVEFDAADGRSKPK